MAASENISVDFTCDKCGATAQASVPPNTNRAPTGWAIVKIIKHDGELTHDCHVCSTCRSNVESAVTAS